MSRALAPALRALRESFLARDGGPVFFAAFAAANASNFVFHVIVSRMLGPSAYGALGALLGLTLVLLVPVTALQMAITQQVAARRHALRTSGQTLNIGPLLSRAVVLAFSGFAIFTALSPLLRSFLHLGSLKAAVLLGAYLVPVVIGLVPKAVLLGQLRFRAVASALVIGAALRLVFGTVLVGAGLGVDGAVGATVVAEIATAAILLVILRGELRIGGDETLGVEARDAWTATAAFAGFWMLTGIDTLLARHFLPRVDSGFYAAAATAARSVLFLPGAVALVAFPRFAAGEGEGVEARRTLVQALALVGALVVGSALALVLFPGLFVRVLFGAAYGTSTAVVGVLAAASACMGLVSVLVHFHLARHSRAVMLPWAGVALATAGIAVAHGSLQAIAFVMVATTAVLLVAMTALAVAPRPGEVRLPGDESDRLLWDLAGPSLDVTIVVPYFNPGPRFQHNLERLVSVVRDTGVSFEVIAVSDGCTDGSERLARRLGDEGAVRCVDLDANFGKGHALRVGLSQARGRYLGFIDADGDLDPSQLTAFLALMRLYEPDIILGSKRHPMSQVHYPPLRRVYSWGYQQLIRVLFRLNVRDTQTGLKLARREVLAAALPRMLEKRFAFDLELIVVARRLGHDRFFEAPVRLGQRFSSTVSSRAVWNTLLDTLAIFYRLRILRYYDRSVPWLEAAPVLPANEPEDRRAVTP